MTISPKNNKPAWFMSESHCPVTGLVVTHPETLVSGEPGSDFHAEVAKLGDHILLTKCHGYVRSRSETELLTFFDEFITKHFESGTRLVYIEDYAAIAGADAEARKKYKAYFVGHKNLLAGIAYNVPLIFKISFNLFKKLNIYSLRVDIVDTYEQAIDLSLKIIDRSTPIEFKETENVISLTKSKKRPLYYSFFDLLSEITEDIKFFFSNRSRERFKKFYAKELLKHIASVDWQKPGGQPQESRILTDMASRKIFDVISFVQSEIYSLLEERKAAEKVLKESEEKYRLLVEHTKAGIFEYDYDTQKIMNPNQAILDITGYTKDEFLSMSLLNLLDQENKKKFQHRLSQLYAGESISSEIVYQIVTKTRDLKWILVNVNITYHDNQPKKANMAVTDITRLKTIGNKLMEYQAKLKKLSVQLSMSEEEQRRMLASRFHDDVSQELFVAQLQLDSFEKSLDNPVQVVELSKIKNHIVKLIKEMRNLIFDLSPPVLYDFGFKEALETLAQVTESKYNLHVATKFVGDMDLIDEEIKIILYRNIKELIHNTIKHAQAKNIIVSVHNAQHTLGVNVEDDGVGLDIKNYAIDSSSPDGFGLFDIKEKMSHLGGKLNIDSAPGYGTSIFMEVPLKTLN